MYLKKILYYKPYLISFNKAIKVIFYLGYLFITNYLLIIW